MRVIPFMRYKWWFLISLTAVTIFAIIFVFVVRLDLGIEFKGGTRMQIGVEQEATVDDVRSLVSDLGVKDPVVQSVTGASGENSFLITAEEMDDAMQQRVKQALDEKYTLQADTTSVDHVGASFGKETTNRAFIAVAVAMIVIILYLTFRFELKFAIPAIVALIHDVGLTLGIYAAGHRLVTAATVAAILTILGYSVHDTIVVFDRMRENTLFMKKETYSDMADLSIAQTMVRSINTSVAILLPLVAILIFGGPTLKDFALALTIGVITGTYSSFFVATPLAVVWKEREPRYRKRLVGAGAGGAEIVVEPAVAAAEAGTTGGKAPGKAAAGQAVKPRAQQKPKKAKTQSKRPAGKAPKRTSR